jgi:hypothetical protein
MRISMFDMRVLALLRVQKRSNTALGKRAWTFACKTEKQTPDGKPVWLRLVYAGDTKIRRHVKIRGMPTRLTRGGRTT